MIFTYGFCVCLVITISLHSVVGLTTFGKSQPNNQHHPQPTPIVRGRDCSVESDCAGIQNTSCVPDPIDKKLHCLCGDNKAPHNGQCTSKYKGVGHACVSDRDCLEGGACVQNNMTAEHGLPNAGAPRICRCVDGYSELDNICNDADTILSRSLRREMLIGAFVLVMAAHKQLFFD